jgi:hypothetical protein
MEWFTGMCGVDPILGSGGKVEERTLQGWERRAEREAQKMSRRDHFTWNGVVVKTGHGTVRVSFGAQRRMR